MEIACLYIITVASIIYIIKSIVGMMKEEKVEVDDLIIGCITLENDKKKSKRK
jgi:hypothetical protein